MTLTPYRTPGEVVMRRWFVGPVLGGAAALLLAGCGAPAGSDGNLVDDWATMSEPAVRRPVVGTCYTGPAAATSDIEPPALTSVPCTASHLSETVHVGDVTGDDAAGSRLPTSALRKAFADCDAAVKQYLGDDWRTGRLELMLIPATDRQWEGGGRFYRCDLATVADEGGKIVTQQASVKDGLRGEKPLAVRCANDSGDSEKSVDRIAFVDCAEKHTAEFTGIYTVTPAGRPYPKGDELTKIFLAGCEQLAAKYLGVAAKNIADGLAWLTWGQSEKAWNLGNQSVRCYVGVFDRKKPIRGGATLKGLGTKPIPR